MPEFVRPLTSEEDETIHQLLRSRTVPAGYYVRALILHFSSQGQTPAEIARRPLSSLRPRKPPRPATALDLMPP